MKYIAKSPAFKGNLIFGYDEDENLTSFIVEAKLSDRQWDWLSGGFPVTYTRLKDLTKISEMTVEPVLEDLTFAAFWEAYDYKMGDKKRAEKLWDALPEADRVAAMKAIKRYHYWLACNSTCPTLHATTFLNQRRFEGEFTVKK